MIDGIEKYQQYLGYRYASFKRAFDEFVLINGKTIVELGTTRSFVSGGVRGCMVNDRKYWYPNNPARWDWGAGMFTRVCAESLRLYAPDIHTVDISEDAIEISKETTKEFEQFVHHHLESSEAFLSCFSGQIDLLYMDSGETDEQADELHLREAQIVIGKDALSRKAIVLIDDVNIPSCSDSKGRYSIPFFRQKGYEVLMWDYQVILQRP
jgi:hypothetical protein